MKRISWLLLLSLFLFTPTLTKAQSSTPTNPILFVTQVPVTASMSTIGSAINHHLANPQAAPRGGDLWIRYPDGTLKNLTQSAGYGVEGLQVGEAIAVRDPAVHWSGKKALFSMVIGAPTQYQTPTYYWQLYEITGLGQNETPLITKVPNQPTNFNNVNGTYGSDDRIIFTSDRPRSGEAHLYPQLDEYELAPTNTGLWTLDPTTGELILLNHAPSGDFTPFVDSFGRIVFTQWDHLQRDQQADSDANVNTEGNCWRSDSYFYGTFNYSDESATATILNDRTELFPEPRTCRQDLLAGTPLAGHRFNQFFPWQINQDGTESEILNHLGRHELHGYIPTSQTDDTNLFDFYGQINRFNPNHIESAFFIKEDPTTAGLYYATDSPEFGTHVSGQIIRFSAPPTVAADHFQIEYLTHRDTYEGANTPENSGHYREATALSDGKVVVVHTPFKFEDTPTNNGINTTNSSIDSSYDFRLKMLSAGSGSYWEAGELLTQGISETISFWSPDALWSYSGNLWELNPVEVVARPIPPMTATQIDAPEQAVFDQAGISVAAMQSYLKQNDLALIVVRDATSRDDFDLQQPFNLRVPNGKESISTNGTVYDVEYMQLFQADQLRGWGYYGETDEPTRGRRVLAQPMHHAEAIAANLPNLTGPTGSVEIAADGSIAAFVPARRAMTWQLTDGTGEGVVRERYWLTFQPGEIRSCGSCHGVSEFDQMGRTEPTNEPQALLKLLQKWETVDTTPTAVQLKDSAESHNNLPILLLAITAALLMMVWFVRKVY